MMSIVSNTRVDIVARGVIKACLELGKDPGRDDRDLPHPGRLGGGGRQDPGRLRRRVLRPLGVDARGGRPGRGEDPGGSGMSILIDQDTTFIVQGITGREAVNLTRECLELRLEDRRRGDPGPQGPRRARRAGLRHRPAGRRAQRRTRAGRVGGHGAAGVHQGRGAGGDRRRDRPDRDRDRAHPARRRGADGRGRRRARRPHHRPELPRPGRARRGQDGRHRRPRQEHRAGLPARQRRRDVALGRHDHRDLLDSDRRRPGRVHRRSRSAATRSSAPPTPS